MTWCPMGSIVLDFLDVFDFLDFLVFFDFFVVFVFLVFSFVLFSLWSPLQRVAKYCFFLLIFLYFPCVFWISLNLLTCILKKRAFYLDFEAMWCKIYCKLQWFLDFILGKQHPCEHPFCLNPHIKPLCFS